MKLIILYGNVSPEYNARNQKLIDGIWTCGYREYAKHGGAIVYMSPQNNLKESWEYSFPNGNGLVDWIHQYPDAIVWSLKHGGGKDAILKQIKNFKIYYSCNCKNVHNPLCDISLVDTEARIQNDQCKIFFKGKNPDFWGPQLGEERGYDYVLVGTRDDKLQSFSINQLTQNVPDRRRILWIGGKKFKNKINRSHHKIHLTDVLGAEGVRDHLCRSKIGILYTQHPREGFPQAFLEMTMCGVPTIYPRKGAPRNDYYFHDGNSRIIKSKGNIAATCEDMLSDYEEGVTDKKCREIAIENYSINRSIENFQRLRRENG